MSRDIGSLAKAIAASIIKALSLTGVVGIVNVAFLNHGLLTFIIHVCTSIE